MTGGLPEAEPPVPRLVDEYSRPKRRPFSGGPALKLSTRYDHPPPLPASVPPCWGSFMSWPRMKASGSEPMYFPLT